MKVTALAGGVGGAKLLVGLDRVLPSSDLTAVVNVGDDAEIYGVHISPDIDIVTYWLANLVDTERGWGLKDDTFSVVDALGDLGQENWFRLGDRDLATCMLRTTRLAQGATLSTVTGEIASSLGVRIRLLPASDDPVRTHVVTNDERVLPFQDYFVKEHTKPEVTEVRYEGIDSAKPAPGVLDAIIDCDIVVLCPSNPVLSIAPIVDLPEVRDALIAHPLVVAVSPIVGGQALKGPADRLLKSLGGAARSSWVAHLYRDFCDVFVLDKKDEDEIAAVSKEGPRPIALDTIMSDRDASARLASELLNSAKSSEQT